MTLGRFLRLAALNGIDRQTIDAVLGLIVVSVRDHRRLSIPYFGTFVRHDMPPRTVRHPAGGTSKAPASWWLGFRPGKGAKGSR